MPFTRDGRGPGEDAAPTPGSEAEAKAAAAGEAAPVVDEVQAEEPSTAEAPTSEDTSEEA
jgi:hypothetical protein